MRVIAYTYEADYHCPVCAAARFGTDEHGYVYGTDSECNEVHPVFSTDEWYNIGEGNQTLVCGTCGREMDEYEEEDEERYSDLWGGGLDTSEDEEPEPDDEDLYTSDHIHFFYLQKPAFTVEEGVRMESAIRAWMQRFDYFPNVWFQSDHGNMHLIEYWKED